ncbi:MAG: DUF3592 domain-containing protein [Alphaproteobacteria bacterium]|nr:DUF3592 domain-containing protein [Alphaproteobacteria bacterium]MBV9370370.1 DUF3592 domain-containing protein [Alphaproteobacteria bacterium]MBV9901973.1 DUF3592 domain-containing protein [Alphaproteobacteria bacterium]
MTKNVKAALIVGAVLALLGGFVWHAIAEGRKMTAAGTATVIGSEFVRDSDSSSLDETRVRYRFEAGGKPVEGSHAVSGPDRTGDYPAGGTVQICYNPQEPESSRLNTGGACG